MPISPEARWLYPIDWRELSRLVRFGRAKGVCEHCGRPHGREVAHLGDGRWWDEERQVWRDRRGRRVRASGAGAGQGADRAVGVPEQPDLPLEPNWTGPETVRSGSVARRSRVVLAAAHLDHDPSHNRLSNLAALCQACHMRHDAAEHRRVRWTRAFAQRAAGDLLRAVTGSR